MKKFKEDHKRTITKVITWRILLTLSHIINGFIATGSVLIGLQIAGLAAIINSILFWIHERVWNIAQWNRKDKDEKIFVEGQPRTISKIITWRILITASNLLIPYIMTGSWGSAIIFAGTATIINMFLFWAHERIWNLYKWGKNKIEISPA